jgi:hypothetical protein
MDYAAASGNIEMLEWLYKHNTPISGYPCSLAARYGKLDAIIWSYNHGARFTESWLPTAFAAQGGYLEVLKWLHEHNCPWCYETCSRAAFNGHLNVIIYAHENGCNWNYETYCSAIKGNHLHILQYAKEKNCPWHDIAFKTALEQSNLETIKWILDNKLVDLSTNEKLQKDINLTLKLHRVYPRRYIPLINFLNEYCQANNIKYKFNIKNKPFWLST